MRQPMSVPTGGPDGPAGARRPLRIAVIGQSGPIDPAMAEAARRVGAAVAAAGAILFTGGRDGVMAAASQGAREAGGLAVGILPGDDLGEANPYLTVPVTTGLTFLGRSEVLMHAVDAAVMVGGGAGTLAELAMGYLYRKPLVALKGSGGWADRLEPLLLEGRFLDHRRLTPIHFATSPEEAVGLAVKLAAVPPERRGGEAAAAGAAAAGLGDVPPLR